MTANNDYTYCSNHHECEMAHTCRRANWPDDITHTSFGTFYDEDMEGCGMEYFDCSCSLARFVGSTKHGNYYSCPVCGAEGEG